MPCSASSASPASATSWRAAFRQGERKLLDVALAYALKPKLLFLDEPTSGVSTRDKGQIMDTIASVVRGEGITAVVVEHDMDVVFKYSDRIVVMHQGAILAAGHARCDPDQRAGRHDPARLVRPGCVRKKGLTVLEVNAIDTYRGPAHILNGVSLRVDKQEVVCLVGRNGAGKTTTIDSIMGFLPVRAGQIVFQDEDLTGLPPHERAKRGIGYSPEDCGVFPELSVGENLMISRWLGDEVAKRRSGGGAAARSGGAGVRRVSRGARACWRARACI